MYSVVLALLYIYVLSAAAAGSADFAPSTTFEENCSTFLLTLLKKGCVWRLQSVTQQFCYHGMLGNCKFSSSTKAM